VNLGDVDRELVKAARVVRIREAIASNSDEAIAAAANPDPHEVLGVLEDHERARVERALQAAKPLAGRKSFMIDPATPASRQSGSGSTDRALTPGPAPD
jgi:hypothetical protein